MHLAVKLVHELLTVVAVGFDVSYAVWLRLAGRDPAKLRFALRGIKVLDDRFANPAYVLLLVSGVALALLGDVPLTALWLALSTVLLVVALVVAYAAYTPLLRRQIALLDAEGPDGAGHRAGARRLDLVGRALGALVAVVLGLMVFQPVLGP